MWWLFKKKKPKTKALVVGATSGSSILILASMLLIGPWEGNILKPYLDVGGVPTACEGITGPEIDKAYEEGRIFTDEECKVMNLVALKEHKDKVDKCLKVDVPDLTMVSYISFTYNVGGGAFCRSTLLKKANAGDIKGSCEELSRWVFVNGNAVNGLVNRRVKGDNERVSERTVCLIGIDPSYETPLFEKLYAKARSSL